MVKNLPANAGGCKRPGLDHWVEKIPWRSSPGNLSQYSCLENPMDRGVWWAAIHGVAKRHDWRELAVAAAAGMPLCPT